MVVTAYYSDGQTQVVTDYTYSPTRPLTVSDTTVTVTYSDKTATQTISVASGAFKIYKGLSSTVPTTAAEIEALILDTSKTKSTLLSSGYSYKRISPDNQYVLLAIEKSEGIYCSKIEVNGFSLGYNEIEIGNYLLYCEENPATLSNITYDYSFEEAE